MKLLCTNRRLSGLTGSLVCPSSGSTLMPAAGLARALRSQVRTERKPANGVSRSLRAVFFVPVRVSPPDPRDVALCRALSKLNRQLQHLSCTDNFIFEILLAFSATCAELILRELWPGACTKKIRDAGDWTGFGWRFDMISMISMIRTMTRVKRIPVLALFIVSAMEFILERAGTNLVVMTGALAILLWGRSRKP